MFRLSFPYNLLKIRRSFITKRLRAAFRPSNAIKKQVSLKQQASARKMLAGAKLKRTATLKGKPSVLYVPRRRRKDTDPNQTSPLLCLREPLRERDPRLCRPPPPPLPSSPPPQVNKYGFIVTADRRPRVPSQPPKTRNAFYVRQMAPTTPDTSPPKQKLFSSPRTPRHAPASPATPKPKTRSNAKPFFSPQTPTPRRRAAHEQSPPLRYTPENAKQVFEERKIPMTPENKHFLEEVERMRLSSTPLPELERTRRIMEENGTPEARARRIQEEKEIYEKAKMAEEIRRAHPFVIRSPGPLAGERTWQDFERKVKEGKKEIEKIRRREIEEEQRRRIIEQRWKERLAEDNKRKGEMAVYERKWDELKVTAGPQPPLMFSHLPWPVFLPASFDYVLSSKALTLPAVREFFFYQLGSQERHERVRQEMLRWHPDKFDARVLPRVLECEQEKVKEGAGLVMRLLLTLKEEVGDA